MPFPNGQSADPAGRPISRRRKVAELVEAMLEDASEELIRRTIERAMAGDTAAMRLCLDRVLPGRRGRPAPFWLSRIEGPDDMPRAASEIWEAVRAGALTPHEAAGLLRVTRRAGGLGGRRGRTSMPGHQTKKQ